MRDTSAFEVTEPADAVIVPQDGEDVSGRSSSSPSTMTGILKKRNSRAMPVLSVLDTKIEMIEEEEGSDEDKKSKKSKTSTVSNEVKEKIEDTKDNEEIKNGIGRMNEDCCNDGAVPTTSKDNQDQLVSTDNNSHHNKSTAEPHEFYLQQQPKVDDPIEEYYKRNMTYLTVTSMSSMYEKSTEMRRLPDYLKQMRGRRGTIHSKRSYRSGRSAASSRSRIGLPQVPMVTHSNKFVRSFYFLASKHRKIGFRHIIMLVLVSTYTLIGATLFSNIEGRNEKQSVKETNENLIEAISIIARDLKITSLSTNASIDTQVKNAYISLLEIEGKYVGSTFYKLQTEPPRYTWTFASAFFYSFTVFTTIGYGSIAPVTYLGKGVTIVYAFICIPLTMVVIRDLGQFVLVTLTKIYARLLIKLRAARGYLTTESESISLPIKFCSLLSVSYVLAAGVFIYNFDALVGGNEEGMDLFNAVYFSFISITTVGLGDVMPSNATFSPLIAIVFFFGLPIMRVVNRVSYVALENGVFGTLALLEQKIDHEMSGCESSQPTAHAPAASGVKPSTTSSHQDAEGRPVSPGSREEPNRLAVMSADDYDASDLEDDEENDDTRARNEMMNNFTIRSLATLMKARSDVYGGDFGRVNVRKADL